ncbi:hypothetical protein RUND412_011626, partial [Rhizina undulata]
MNSAKNCEPVKRSRSEGKSIRGGRLPRPVRVERVKSRRRGLRCRYGNLERKGFGLH